MSASVPGARVHVNDARPTGLALVAVCVPAVAAILLAVVFLAGSWAYWAVLIAGGIAIAVTSIVLFVRGPNVEVD
jgi:hypothetical protein